MNKFQKNMIESYNELKNIKSLTFCGLMMAIAAFLSLFSVQVNDIIKITFAFIPDAIVGMLFGPFTGMAFAGLADIVRYVVKPTGAFFPGFTLSAMVSGFIYGLILYKKPIKLSRCFIAILGVTIVSNIMLNTIWLHIMYGIGWKYLFTVRLIKELALLPINTIMLFTLSKALERPLSMLKTNIIKN